MLYIAYGSNLHLPSMARRCPGATVAGGTTIQGYDLRFRSGLATVEPSENGAVPVLAWEIGELDEQALDHYEAYPRLYRKEVHPVELGGETVDAMVYVMNDGHPYREPESYYYDVIREGYETATRAGLADFDPAYLDAAIERSIELALEQEKSQASGFEQQFTP